MQKATYRLVRSHKALAVLAAASSLAVTSKWAGAQTWVNPNSGSWSVGTNWVGGLPPVPGATTALTFNATGTQTYTAFNNIANPFALNAVNFNNAGTGVVTIAGQDVLFNGASPGMTKAGNGAVTISNNLQFTTTGAQDPTNITGA